MHVTQLKLIANQGEIIREIQGVGLKLEGSTPKGKCVGCDNGRDGANGGANEFASVVVWWWLLFRFCSSRGTIS